MKRRNPADTDLGCKDKGHWPETNKIVPCGRRRVAVWAGGVFGEGQGSQDKGTGESGCEIQKWTLSSTHTDE